MFKNFVKIAWRNLTLNKTYSFINIAGLSIGLMVSTFILLFVVHELNFDKFHLHGDKIFKVDMAVKHGDQTFNIDGMRADLANKIKESNAAVVDHVRLKDIGKVILKNNEDPTKKFKEKSFVFVDKSFFSVFTFPLVQGDILTALQNPFTLIVSEDAAKKYFNSDNPIGKTMLCDGKHVYKVTGVMKDVPSNSSMSFDFVTSLETYPKLGAEEKNIWEKSGAFPTYVLLNDENKLLDVQKSISEFNKDQDESYSLHQYSTQHLNGGFNKNLNARFVYIFSGIGLLILFLALFNYMSLTTARATTRAKEVGVRKVAGVSRAGLIKQFYFESILLCSLAFGLALLLIQGLLKSFYNLVGVQIDTSFLSNPITVALLAVLFITTIFLAGSYPALILSKFKPIDVLKGKFTSKQGGSMVRKGIIVFQFAVSIALMICVIITKKQLNYLKNQDLGFSQSQVLAIPTEQSMNNNFLSFKNEIKQMTGVQSITSAAYPFYKGYNAWFTKSLASDKDVFLYSMTTDENFMNTIGLKWAKPPVNNENLDKKVFINEVAAKQLEIGDDYRGKLVELGDSKMEIGGILKDFHFNAMREEIKPLSISVYSENKIDFERSGQNPTIYVRFEGQTDIAARVKSIKEIYEKYKAESPFEYYFLDDAFNEMFSQQARLSTIFTLFSSIALFIACLGLFGLATFMAGVRTKEIGIRKVLGASVFNITSLLSKDFLILVFVAIILASPFAYYFMNKWLQEFAFRINISWWIFALAAGLSFLIALLTVSSQAIKVAISNPTKSLRTE